jgi:arylsulfatase A-like enzyme
MNMPLQPNIIFFFPDQHRPDWLSGNPNLSLRTPNINRLKSQGVMFTRAYTPSPLCAPARACLASGKAYNECPAPNNDYDYPLDIPTYYQALRRTGYRVVGVGKFDLHKDTRDSLKLDWNLDGSRCLKEWGFTDGIDNEGKLDGSNSYRVDGKPKGPYLAYLQKLGLAETYIKEHEQSSGYMGAYTTSLPDEAYCDNWLSENGLRFLRGFPKDQPWHLVVNFTGPHNPMDVTKSMRDKWAHTAFPLSHNNDYPDQKALLRSRQNYAAMIENIDHQVGRFIDLVREREELENTLIVYTSDHGEMLGDHSRWGKGTWYSASVGIPLIVCGPGVKKGVVSDALVSLQDLAATFLDYAGTQGLPKMEALSLRALLEGRKDDHRKYVISGLNEWRMVFDGRYKLIMGAEHSPILFDLQNDLLEDKNIAKNNPNIVKRLTQVIEFDRKRSEQNVAANADKRRR